MTATGTGDITIVRDADGRLHLEHGSEPPVLTSFTRELVDCFRRSGSLWASIDGDTIEMRLTGLTLWYRLTGETDFAGALVAQRVTADGRVWPC